MSYQDEIVMRINDLRDTIEAMYKINTERQELNAQLVQLSTRMLPLEEKITSLQLEFKREIEALQQLRIRGKVQ